jgi:hypothetical protein
MTPIFLLRYREACKLPPSPRWSPLQGPSSQLGNSVDSLESSPCASGSLIAFREAYPARTTPPAISTIKLSPEMPQALFLWYTVMVTPQKWLVWSCKATSPAEFNYGVHNHLRSQVMQTSLHTRPNT